MTEKTKQIHEAYLLCKEVFVPSMALMDEASNIHDEEELLFFRAVSEFFIGRKQEEIIKYQ